jgi:MFS family permease
MVSASPTAGLTVPVAALAAAIASTISIAARIGLGLLIDRLGVDPLPMVACLIGLGAIGYFLLSLGQPAPFLIGVGLVLVPGWVWVNLLLYGVLARYRDDVATTTGMASTTFFVGSVIGPAAVGALIAVTSFGTAWLTLAIAVAIGATVVAVLSRRLPPFDRAQPTASDVTAGDTLRQP